MLCVETFNFRLDRVGEKSLLLSGFQDSLGVLEYVGNYEAVCDSPGKEYSEEGAVRGMSCGREWTLTLQNHCLLLGDHS
jgi:hypothetical protein